MLVSVIMPAYNADKYIGNAINSVLDQTYDKWEIIVIDDGSNDNTRDIVKSFEDSRIKYIYQENAGVASARNNGIKQAKGEFIAFLDSDDIWKSNKLEIQLKKIESDDDICMVYSGYEMVYYDSDLCQICRYNHELRNEKNFIKNLLINPFSTIPFPSTVLLRKSFLDRAGEFNPEHQTGEDWDLWLRLAALGRCCYVDYILTTKMTHNTNLSNSFNIKDTGEQSFFVVDKFFENNPEYSFLKSKAHSEIYFELACRSFARKNYEISKEFYENLFQSFIKWPTRYFTRPRIRFMLKVFGKTLDALNPM